MQTLERPPDACGRAGEHDWRCHKVHLGWSKVMSSATKSNGVARGVATCRAMAAHMRICRARACMLHMMTHLVVTTNATCARAVSRHDMHNIEAFVVLVACLHQHDHLSPPHGLQWDMQQLALQCACVCIMHADQISLDAHHLPSRVSVFAHRIWPIAARCSDLSLHGHCSGSSGSPSRRHLSCAKSGESAPIAAFNASLPACRSSKEITAVHAKCSAWLV